MKVWFKNLGVERMAAGEGPNENSNEAAKKSLEKKSSFIASSKE